MVETDIMENGTPEVSTRYSRQGEKTTAQIGPPQIRILQATHIKLSILQAGPPEIGPPQ